MTFVSPTTPACPGFRKNTLQSVQGYRHGPQVHPGPPISDTQRTVLASGSVMPTARLTAVRA